MTEQDKSATEPQNSAIKAVSEGAERLEKVTHDAKEQVLDVVAETQEKLQAEAKQLNASVQEQLGQLKQDVLQKIEALKAQFGSSPKDLGELKDFVKTEFSAIIDDLSKLGKELKEDVSSISVKHKDQLAETFKRSKEHTLEAWKKVNPSKTETNDETDQA